MPEMHEFSHDKNHFLAEGAICVLQERLGVFPVFTQACLYIQGAELVVS